MCLEVLMTPAVQNKVSPDRLSKMSGLSVVKRRGLLRSPLSVSFDGGCACSLLDDEADWDAPNWIFDPSVLEGLACVLKLLHDEAGGFTFQALWIGDKPQTQAHVTLRELLADVAINRIRNKHVYVVGKAAE